MALYGHMFLLFSQAIVDTGDRSRLNRNPRNNPTCIMELTDVSYCFSVSLRSLQVLAPLKYVVFHCLSIHGDATSCLLSLTATKTSRASYFLNLTQHYSFILLPRIEARGHHELFNLTVSDQIMPLTHRNYHLRRVSYDL